jgi:hypothetical protein
MRRNLALALAFALLLLTPTASGDAQCRKCRWHTYASAIGVECTTPNSDEWGSESCRTWGRIDNGTAIVGCDDTDNMCYYYVVNP